METFRGKFVVMEIITPGPDGVRMKYVDMKNTMEEGIEIQDQMHDGGKDAAVLHVVSAKVRNYDHI